MSKCELCNRYAYYNIKGLGRRFCSTHKEPGMVNVVIKKCEEENCDTAATYNIPTEKSRPVRCSKHKLPGMVDVKHTHCELCYNVATRKFPGQKPTRCELHVLPEMIGADNRTCRECNTAATFGYENTKERLYCSFHKKENMVDLVSQKCKNPGCTTQVYCHSNNDYCYECYHTLFPDAPIVRNHNTKERNIAKHVERVFNHINKRWIFDTPIPGSRSRRRPDMFGDYGEYVIIVDVDERQHKYYDADDEDKRDQEIAEAIGNRPCIYIRFNPDTYLNSRFQRIKGCWKKNEDNVLELVNEPAWIRRLRVLLLTVFSFVLVPPAESKNVDLFFDGFADDDVFDMQFNSGNTIQFHI